MTTSVRRTCWLRSATCATEDAAAARKLTLAARWADLHPPESIHDAAAFTVAGSEHEEPIAGPGCPSVAEFCIPELGTVLGVSTTAAKRLLGHALELRHRLPRLWDQVHAGRVPAWRARRVAEATIHTTPALTPEAAGWVDAQVAAVAGKVGAAQLERLVAEAIKRYELSEDKPFDPDDWQQVDPRHVTIDRDDVHFAGTLHLEADLDLADGIDLDHALAHGAAVRKALGSTDTLNVRRAQALGDLARTQTALDLAGATGDEAGEDSGAVLPAAREVVLHAHFNAASDGQATVFGPTGRLEEGQRLILLDQVKAWCGESHTKITIRPVIDLNARLTASGYAIPDRLREQVILRDRTCVFPWCTRPSRRCQVDHVIAYDHTAQAEGRPQPGPTETPNLACLCTFHHRLKTHSSWRYLALDPGRLSGRARTAQIPPRPRRWHHRPRTTPTGPPEIPAKMIPPRTPPTSVGGATGTSSGVEFGGSPGQCTNSTSTVAIVL